MTAGTPHRQARRKHAGLFLPCVLVALATHAAAPAAAQTAPLGDETDYNIAAESLDQALAAYARISGVDILYVQGLTADRRSTALAGRYPVAAALRTLLQGSGLSARFTGRKAAIVFVAGEPPPTEHARQPGLPTLRLDMAQVRAPTVIGEADRSALDAYAEGVQSEIHALLARDPLCQGHAFRVVIAVRIASRGQIETVTLRKGSGDAARDDHILRSLTGRNLSRPPPAGLTRALQFEIDWRPLMNRG